MSWTIVISEQAHLDIERNAIWWAGQHSIRQALAWQEIVYRQLAEIADMPESVVAIKQNVPFIPADNVWESHGHCVCFSEADPWTKSRRMGSDQTGESKNVRPYLHQIEYPVIHPRLVHHLDVNGSVSLVTGVNVATGNRATHYVYGTELRETETATSLLHRTEV